MLIAENASDQTTLSMAMPGVAMNKYANPSTTIVAGNDRETSRQATTVATIGESFIIYKLPLSAARCNVAAGITLPFFSIAHPCPRDAQVVCARCFGQQCAAGFAETAGRKNVLQYSRSIRDTW